MLTLYGRLIDFSCRPASDSGETFVVRDTPGGALSIAADGRIKWIGTQASLPPSFRDDRVVDHGDCWILPGFVDAHLHFPQYRMLAAHGADLLGWLQRFTFPEEVRFQDPAICERAAERFLDHLVTNGITSCLAFSSSHSCSVDAIFESAFRRNMALATGNVLMNRGAPKELLQTPEDSYDDSRQLINRWNGRGRLRYAVSPRFAMTSTEAQLEVAGQLVRENPNVLLQTHLSENRNEVRQIRDLFPWSRDYTDVYDRFGFLRPGSLFAHGVHLEERELQRLSESGSTIVHCPTSNSFLGSGLFCLRQALREDRPVAVGIGCDIGAGTSYSPFQTMREAYLVSQLTESHLTPIQAYYMYTLGNATRLGWEDELGSLEVGKFADLVIINPVATTFLEQRQELSEGINDELFAVMILGDDRVITQTYIAGQPMKSSSS